MQTKLKEKQYKCGREFAEDVRTIFNNCFKYNPAGHDVVVMANKLKNVFEDE